MTEELVNALTEEYKKELQKLIQNEILNKKLLPQTILGCRWRAKKGLKTAFKKALPIMSDMGGIAIAKHRELKHGENWFNSIQKMASRLTGSQIEKASSSAWLA